MSNALAALELRQLRYFVAVAEEQNLSRAAVRLSISQPPLTRIIHGVEAVIGAPLFVRSARGMTLTPAGEAMYAEARRLLDIATGAVERARLVARGEAGHLNIAGFGALMLDAVPRFLQQFRRTHPGVTISLQTLNRSEQVQALRDGRVDVAFIRPGTNPPDIVAEPFVPEALVAALPTSDPLATRSRIKLSDLSGRPFIVQGSGPRPNFTDALLAMCANAGCQIDTMQTAGDSLTAVALVAGGFGVALVANSATFLRLPGVAYVPISNATPGIVDLECVYRRGAVSPPLGLFLKELRNFRSSVPRLQANRRSPKTNSRAAP